MSESRGRKPPSVGAELSFAAELQQSLDACRDAALDFCVLPLFHPRNQRSRTFSSLYRAQAFGQPATRSDTLLTSAQWGSIVVGRLSRWLRFEGPTAGASELALKEEVAWATHLSLPAVLCSAFGGNVNFARILNSLLTTGQHALNVWVDVPANEWTTWNKIRALCDFSSVLHVALRLTPNGTTSQDEAGVVNGGGGDGQGETGGVDVHEQGWNRWCGEPVRALILSTSLFVPNASGYPTLPPRLRKIVVRFYERGAQFILSGRARHKNGLLPYQMYLVHLCTKSGSAISQREEFEAPFYDYLQIPLQPLGDNLESQTYETFEKDPVKYARYEEAVKLALVAAAAIAPASGDLVVMVVGAGRGPLVRASLRAAESANLLPRVRIFAVEKNPNAIVTLLNAWPKGLHNTQHRVEVVSRDMRKWRAPEKADVIVSELLGSWGDNELSPECLLGVERFLKPTGVSVPYHYDSLVAPISSQKIWSEVRSLGKGPMDLDPTTSAARGVTRFETPYVVRLFHFFHVDDPKVCFSFQHAPRPAATATTIAKDQGDCDDNSEDFAPNADLERFTQLSFCAREDSTIHGFAGYFTAYLFDQVNISIAPQTYSEGMFSWFPLFIPLREPVFVRKNEKMVASFWRKRSATHVWYEWCLETESGVTTAIHNPTGRSYSVNL